MQLAADVVAGREFVHEVDGRVLAVKRRGFVRRA